MRVIHIRNLERNGFFYGTTLEGSLGNRDAILILGKPSQN
jgi:hypothetical protein